MALTASWPEHHYMIRPQEGSPWKTSQGSHKTGKMLLGTTGSPLQKRSERLLAVKSVYKVSKCDTGQRGCFSVQSQHSGQALLKAIYLFCYVNMLKMKIEKIFFGKKKRKKKMQINNWWLSHQSEKNSSIKVDILLNLSLYALSADVSSGIKRKKILLKTNYRGSYVIMKVTDRHSLKLMNSVANVHQYSAAHSFLFLPPLDSVFSACMQSWTVVVLECGKQQLTFPHTFFEAKE